MSKRNIFGAFVLVFMVLEVGAETTEILQKNIDRSQVLHDLFSVSWSVDFEEEKVTFHVVAKTQGYVGFGLSHNGNMKGGDMIIGGVNADGTTYFSDRHAVNFDTPIVDEKQDWHLLSASQNDTHTKLSFYRAFHTCDDQDIPITHDTINMIWSVGSSDNLEHHIARGNQQANLLDPPQPPTENLDYWSFRLPSVVPTEKDTSYWCTIHRGPVFPNKTHIIGFDMHLKTPESIEHTHHMILRKCILPPGMSRQEFEKTLDPWLGHIGMDCVARENLYLKKLCSANIYTWTKGAGHLIFPEHVGFPIGEGPLDEYYSVEMHYDNPKLLQNVNYHSEVRVFYTEKLRENDAGFLFVGHEVDASLTVAPNVSDWKVVAHCSSDCTRKMFPPQGINLFNVLLHAHLTGRKLKLRHFGSDGVEKPWIQYDDNYDFNFQQTRHLKKEIKVEKGDHLTMECTYDSTWMRPIEAVSGGLASTLEMCESWIFYYPRIPALDVCSSTHGNFRRILQKIGVSRISFEEDLYRPTVMEPESLKGLSYLDVLTHHVNWTDGFYSDFQDELVQADHKSVCEGWADWHPRSAGFYDDDEDWPVTNYPKTIQEYKPKPLNYYCLSTSFYSSSSLSSGVISLQTLFFSLLSTLFLLSTCVFKLVLNV